MRMLTRSLRHAIVILLALLTLAAVPVVATAGNANANAAKACQNGGYTHWTTADGTPFANAGQCVDYVAHGNQLRPVAPPPSLRLTPWTATDLCGFILHADNFPDGTYWAVTTGGPGTPSTVQYAVTIPTAEADNRVGAHVWNFDGNVYHITASIYTAQGGDLIATTTGTFQC